MLSLRFIHLTKTMQDTQPLSSRIIASRLSIVGTNKFNKLGLSKEELQIFLTVEDRQNWTDNMRAVIPKLEKSLSDEEEE